MTFKEFIKKYEPYRNQFNDQSYEERIRVSRLMIYEAIKELIRSKQNLQDAILEVDDRIKILSKELDEGLNNPQELQDTKD